MTDLMIPAILVQPTCPGDQRAKGVQFQSTCNQCRESHKTQVWLCFLVLSFLSTSTCAVSVPEIAEVQMCLQMLQQTIQKSDALLYAPSIQDVQESCIDMSLKCYMLELVMVIREEEITTKRNCILDFSEKLSSTLPNSDGCRPCEAYSLNNITIFLERLNDLLELMNVQRRNAT